jgi:hypothetical protein
MGARPRNDEGFEPELQKLIHTKVQAMFGPSFNHHDREDAEQELSLQVWLGLQRHNPARASRRAHAACIINSKAITLLKREFAGKRDRRRQRALDQAICVAVPEVDQDLALDVKAVVSSLDRPSIATLFELYSVAEIFRLTGLSRQQIRTARVRIAEHFRAHGIKPPTNRRTSNHSAEPSGTYPVTKRNRASRQ